jgi:hypothetical protein
MKDESQKPARDEKDSPFINYQRVSIVTTSLAQVTA